MKNIVVTGGAGFIGSHVVRLFVNKYLEYHVICLDKLTYAGNLENLKDLKDRSNYEFVKMDICDFEAFLRLMREKRIDGIIHLAAESHVDRSIKDPFTFAQTNVMGTLSLLQAAKLYWESLPEKYTDKLFYHISTDEVYGALELMVLNLLLQPRPLLDSVIRHMAIPSLKRQQNITLILLIQHLRRVVIILFVLIMILTVCLQLLQIVQIIMALINFLKN